MERPSGILNRYSNAIDSRSIHENIAQKIAANFIILTVDNNTQQKYENHKMVVNQ